MTNIKDKPGGRPAKKRIEKQQRVVSTKLTELQYYAIRKRAGEAGLRVSEYVRQAVVSAEVIPRLNRQDADTIRKLAGEANNINQLAHRANAGGFALVAVELVKLKNRIVEIINQLSDDWKNKKGKRVYGLRELCAGQGTGGFALCGRGTDRKPGRYNPQLLYADRDESRLEKASRTYCAKLFGSGCAQIVRRENDTACAGIYA